jgi:WD40 repeat protein
MADQISNRSEARYRAFISYNRSDRATAVELQQRLERYVLPQALRMAKPGLRHDARPLKPIFRDEDELVPGQDLPARIEKALREAEFLIVICSPAAARSEWVEREIREFTALGKGQEILAVVASGEPHAARKGADPALECLPPSFQEREPLWVDWRKPAAQVRSNFLRVVAALLSLASLDELIRRDAEYRRRQAFLRVVWAGLALAVLAGGGIGIGLLTRADAIAKSNTLALAAEQSSDAGDYERATRLALIAIRTYPGSPALAALGQPVNESARSGSPLRGDVGDDVVSVAFSPDGKTLAAGVEGSSNKFVRLWDPATGRRIGRPIVRDSAAVYGLAFAADGRSIAGAKPDENEIWDNDLLGEEAFSPDGRYRAWTEAGDPEFPDRKNTAIHLESVRGGAPVAKPLLRQARAVTSMKFSPDGRLLAVGSDNGSVLFLDVATGQRVGETVVASGGSVTAVAFSPNGSVLGTGSVNGSTEIWDVATGRRIGKPFIGHQDAVTSIAFSPDSRSLATGSRDGSARLWRLSIRQPIQQGGTIDDRITSVAFSPDGTTLGVGSWGSVCLWDAASGRKVRCINRVVDSVVFSSNREAFITGSGVGDVQLWSMATGMPIGAPLKTLAEMVSAGFTKSGEITIGGQAHLVLSSDGKSMAGFKSDDGVVRVVDVVTGRMVGHDMATGDKKLSAVAFVGDGKQLATGSGKMIQIWDVPSGRPIGQPFGTIGEFGAGVLAASPDGRTLASSSGYLWDVASHEPIGRFSESREDQITSLAFSPDGKTVAVGLWNHTVELASVAATTRFHGEALVAFACAQILPGDLSRIRPAEFAAFPALDRDLDTDACRPEPWWAPILNLVGLYKAA